MNDFKIQDFLGKTLNCKCGREHSVDIDKIIIQKDAIILLPQIIKEYKFKKVFMIADNNTYKVQGSKVERLLLKNDIQFNKCIFNSEKQLIPNEKAIVEMLIEFKKDTDVIIGVGSGTINDLSRFLSFKVDIPYFIIATAPSMDGFASTVSPLIINNLKTTYEARCPKVIFGDIEVLRNAPMDMILAGLGDVIGKYTSLCDWKLGQIINDEYYCEFIVDMVKNAIDKCIDSIKGIKSRDEDAIKNLVEGLIITGIAMSFSGNSRPASGSEHHLAHFWEMMFLFDDKEAVLHGRKVGVTEIVITKLYELLAEVHFDYDKAINKANKFSEDKWENVIRRIYRFAADGIIESNRKEHRNSKEKHIERLNNIQKKWTEIISSVKEIVPLSDKIQSVLKEAGAPINPKQIGVSSEVVSNSLIYGKEIRTRYTVLQLLWDIGVLDELSEKVCHYFNYEQVYGNSNLEIEKKDEMGFASKLKV
jgi:glycerol-1-phosphate dehydrogenase [NAD(P)+]